MPTDDKTRTILTIDDVRRQIQNIELCESDPEKAHSLEDSLHLEVLEAIGDDRCRNPRECARLAASTKDFDFDRWYA